jgi:Rrf2 family protein
MKVDYGVRALVELARHYGVRPVQTSEIAARQGIPESYLDQVLTTLGKHGFVQSRRGPLGGHALAVPPDQITLDRVMNTLGGNVASLECLEDPAECVLAPGCAQREVWREVDEAVQRVLAATSVAGLARRQGASTENAAQRI